MSFIKVSAQPCTVQGMIVPQMGARDLLLNTDLIAAFYHTEIYLKGGADMIMLGGTYYKSFRLAQGEKIPGQQ